MSTTSRTPLRSPPGQHDLVESLAAPGQVDQVEDTIPQIYQDYKRDMDVLWEMVMASENPTEKCALMSGVCAIKTLLLDRGYDAL